MMALIGGIWPYLVGLFGLGAGIVMALFSNQKVKTAQAETEAHAARADQATAALANVTADQTATDDAEKARQAAIAQAAIQAAAIAAQPPGQAFKDLQNDNTFSR